MTTASSARPEYSQHADIEILSEARAGNLLAAREFMTRFNQRLYRAAYAILVSAADAEDVLQDCYLKLFTGRCGEPDHRYLPTWLTRIVINAAIDLRRKRNRRIALMERDGITMLRTRSTDTSDTVVSDASPESEIARQQIAERLQAAISELPVDYRTVFMFRDIEGLSIEQTSSVLEIEPATVKSRLFRARQKLRESLEADWQDILNGTFPFAGRRCEGLADKVIKILESQADGDTK